MHNNSRAANYKIVYFPIIIISFRIYYENLLCR